MSVPRLRAPAPRDRRGIALFAALGVLTLIALLIGGALATSSLRQRSSHLLLGDAQLTAAADYAINSVIADASVDRLADLPLGESVDVPIALPDGPSGITTVVSATRLPNGILWLIADAELGGRDAGSRRINVIERWRIPGAIPNTPLLARGAVRLRSDIEFVADTATAADCALPSTGDVSVTSVTDVTSAHPVRVITDARAGDSSAYFLAAWQRRALDSATSVVHVRGDTTIDGGSFDGILIVDGALTITSSFTISGLVIASGPIAVSDGLSLSGAMMSFAPANSGRYSLDVGAASIRFAPCTITRALRRALPLRPVVQRSWSEFF
jgi:hypothetical protein